MSQDDSYSLQSLFSASIEERADSYVIELPYADFDNGTLRPDTTYRIALLTHDRPQSPASQPPVERGDTRYVEIEDTGKQDDGIARVERGYVLIVPDASVGDRVKVEVVDVAETFAIADVIDG